MSKKQNVGILFGGRSVEHEISIKSAFNVANNIDKNLFEVFLIGIDKQGGWYLVEEVNDQITSGNPVALVLSAGKNHFINQTSNQIIPIDTIFPVLHGTDGEDGSIQGMLTAARIPFVGSGVQGSANAMDKVISKRLLQQAGVPIGKFYHLHYSDCATIDYEFIVDKVGIPFIVKPACLGSSVGITKVSNRDDFDAAVETTFKYDNNIIFEEFIAGRELECGIIGNSQPISTNPGEIVISKAYEFYTYEAKYLDKDAVEIVIPANVNPEIKEKIRSFSVAAFVALNCDDYARVDIFLKDDGTVLVNEINTIPGFTNSSMFPMLWQDSGISYTALISKLINMATARTKENQRLETDFADGEYQN